MAESNHITDFIKVQQNLPSVHKDGTGNYGKHMKLETLMPAALEVLNKFNFALFQPVTTTEDGSPALRTRIVHASGEVVVDDTMLLMLDKQSPQGQGSGITYGRRYQLCSVLGIVADEDDDGQKATDQSGGTTKPAKTTATVDEAPSENQIKLAKDLMNERDYEGLEAVALSKRLIGKNVPTTKAEYSELISKLLVEPKKADKMPDLSE